MEDREQKRKDKKRNRGSSNIGTRIEKAGIEQETN